MTDPGINPDDDAVTVTAKAMSTPEVREEIVKIAEDYCRHAAENAKAELERQIENPADLDPVTPSSPVDYVAIGQTAVDTYKRWWS